MTSIESKKKGPAALNGVGLPHHKGRTRHISSKGSNSSSSPNSSNKRLSLQALLQLVVATSIGMTYYTTTSSSFVFDFDQQQQPHQTSNSAIVGRDSGIINPLKAMMDTSASTSTARFDYDPYRLIFIISMGQEAQQSTMVERFIWSARKNGNWKGWIYLLTDAPVERYQPTPTPTRSHQNDGITSTRRVPENLIEGPDPQLIVKNPQPGHLDMTFKEDMPYKRFKTRTIEYVESDDRLSQVQIIYYLDVDNIVGNDLHRFMLELETKYNIPSPIPHRTSSTPLRTVLSSSISPNNDRFTPTMAATTTTTGNVRSWLRNPPTIWFFENKYKQLSVQGGQFIAVRDSSQPCLDLWRQRIDANPNQPKDQPSLHTIRTDSDSGQFFGSSGGSRSRNDYNCRIVTMKPEKYLYFPSNNTIPNEVKKINEYNTKKVEEEKKRQQRIWPIRAIGNLLWGTEEGQEGTTKRRRKENYPYLIHIKNSCNTTAQIDTEMEEVYIEDIIQNKALSKKIHVQPDKLS